MNLLIYIVLGLLLLLLQFLNGYALVETKLYTPVFTYWLIVSLLGYLGIVLLVFIVKNIGGNS